MKKAKEQSTEERIKQLEGKEILLEWWESQPDKVQIREHDYLIKLRKRVRESKNMLRHRNDPKATDI